ncbi:MAG: site-specific integrase [Bacteroidetes bacterium]|nr:site-specific integrase [Bacteroidota bacterium]
MTELRKRFTQDLQLRNFSERTVEAYVRAVRQLAEHFNKTPDTITEEELKEYFIHNRNVRKWSRSASTISICGIKFFFIHTLGKEWTTFKLVRPPKEKALPEILSMKEVKRIFSCIKMDYHRICLKIIYSLGLRLQEGTHLQVSDIDSDRMFVHVHKGKGAKDRLVPLPNATLKFLRKFWKTHRNPNFLFPAPGRGKGAKLMSTNNKPVPKSSIQIAFQEACQRAKINKKVSVHHLRHSYAVHLLEAGVDFRYVQEFLGHEDPKTTLIYTKLINISLADPIAAINKVMDNIK